MKKVVMVLAEGFEELEAISVIDVLRRANIGVELMGIRDTQITGSHGVTLVCDDVFDFYGSLDFDGVVLVGGMDNAITLSQNEDVLNLLKEYMLKDKLVAGICATPSVVFSEAGILVDKSATCYPSDSLINGMICKEYIDKPCVVCDNVITSQSPDTALEFALTIVQ